MTACALCLCAGFLASPAVADDNGEWFGQTFRHTNLGLSAGVLESARKSRGVEISDDDEVAESRAEGTRQRHKAKGTRVASLGHTYVPPSRPQVAEERVAKRQVRVAPRKRLASLGNSLQVKPTPGPSLAGPGIRWVASSGCLNSFLVGVVQTIASTFGGVTVNSTCRSRRHNARVGGARRSQHLTGNAVDFRVRGNWRAVVSYLRGNGRVGGIKHYGGGLFNVDTGPRRTW
jgi:hypothetical protein